MYVRSERHETFLAASTPSQHREAHSITDIEPILKTRRRIFENESRFPSCMR